MLHRMAATNGPIHSCLFGKRPERRERRAKQLSTVDHTNLLLREAIVEVVPHWTAATQARAAAVI